MPTEESVIKPLSHELNATRVEAIRHWLDQLWMVSGDPEGVHAFGALIETALQTPGLTRKEAEAAFIQMESERDGKLTISFVPEGKRVKLVEK